MSTDVNPIRDEENRRVIRLIRPSVVVLCGPAACGKSTFAARHFRPTQIISSDQARALVCDDERDQRFQTQTFALLHFIIEQRLSINRLCVVDSTALTQPARRNLLDLARRHRVPCVVFLFDVPLAACLERDAKRERTVGQPAIERQYHMFEQAKAALPQEGFDQIIELRDEELEKVQIEIQFRPVPRPAPSADRLEARRPAPGTAGRQGFSRERRWPARERGPVGQARAARTVGRPARPASLPDHAGPAAPAREPLTSAPQAAGPPQPPSGQPQPSEAKEEKGSEDVQKPEE